jgi:hypothetical protein
MFYSFIVKLFTFLVKFISRHLFFEAVVNEFFPDFLSLFIVGL